MIRWYRGHRYKGDPEQLIKEISQLIQQHDLSENVPLLRLQKGAKRGDYFYFFIAIDSETEGTVPLAVNQCLITNRFFSLPAVPRKPNHPFSLEDIKPMVGNIHDVRSYTREMPDHVPEFQRSPVNEELSKRYDHLLFWFSFVGKGNFNSFKNTCEVLQLEIDAKKIQKRLKLLNHIEVDGKQWRICPSTLVETFPQPDYREFILCGQRSPKLIETLKQYTDLEIKSTDQSPSVISIKISRLQELSLIIQQINQNQQLSLNVKPAETLPSLSEWQQTLKKVPLEAYLYEWEKFDGKEFVRSTFKEESGFYQYQHKENDTFNKKHIFYEENCQCFLQGEWYGLRFLALQHLKQSCYANYEESKQQFTIHTANRVPEVYEKALVLCSGLLPMKQGDWLYYEQISSKLAKELINKLNLQEINI